MTRLALTDVLEATGYLIEGERAPGVRLNEEARANRRGRQFEPDALWRSPSAVTVYFKYVEEEPSKDHIAAWRREIWNEGFAPLLWVISPRRIDLYNGFGRPVKADDALHHLLRTFGAIEQELQDLDALAGRLAMETGQFWLQAEKIDPRTSVDRALLADVSALERDLLQAHLERPAAQALIGRSIFTQYLIDRGILDSDQLARACGFSTFPEALRDLRAASRLFEWLRSVFNGDMFLGGEQGLQARHFARIADFLLATDPESGQMSLFPYRFDVIPVELISSIYEQFAHSTAGAVERLASTETSKLSDGRRLGVHYTPLPVVSLVLDEVMDGLFGRETVLDLTCGSGVFLVEALRRLVTRRTAATKPSRQLIRDVLYNQIYGVDISHAAIRVAAFSLYLAALELDPDPRPPEALKFEPLIGRTLNVGDALEIDGAKDATILSDSEGGLKRFDVIVGNPPWTFKGKAGTARRRERNRSGAPAQPRGEGQDFVRKALEFAHQSTRFGIVLSAMPFFSASGTGAAATQDIVRGVAPATLVNLSALSSWLFPTAKMPAMLLLGRCRPQFPDQMTLVNVRWSPAGEKAGTFEISPSDVTSVSVDQWREEHDRLKSAAFGKRRDMALLDLLRSRCSTLEDWLQSIGSDLGVGLIRGGSDERTHDASALKGLPLLPTGQLKPFSVPEVLPLFDEESAERPRERSAYRAPLLLVQEFVQSGGRALTAVADRDLIYPNAYFAASLPHQQREAADLLAAIISSAFASWFFLMTASEFGVWKRRLLKQDVSRLLLPDMARVLQRSTASRKLLEIVSGIQQAAPQAEDWRALDAAVFDLYELDDADRILVEDGLTRASWQWQKGRLSSAAPAEVENDLRPYAEVFVSAIDRWLQTRNVRHMHAEVFDLPKAVPLRVIRFVLEDGPGPSTVGIFRPQEELAQLLDRIGNHLEFRLASAIVGERELRVHSTTELVVVKPNARRFWMRSAALHDADEVIAESFSGASA